ncbi:Stp1/IreP family PP2C-type Ser/Thr phosphatase [Bacillus sp. H-16]|uniref:Stp1/IreP family PP2C-type Ser/Thr phosphatase n=1 Tax=Alteribacter salitolerans TaxID=2912333 RepID=UPI001963C8C7|nr:Stp1/IreP family PP2C-type Ser/Thr phosphatase [Alteribacter salitolerans]MBM7094122.1 Stp1/IreP family PP2C-type Ser/Thr phosphatase [Alteribacter salitolerans]
MEAVFKTDVGRVRAHNEDDGAFAVNEKGQMLVLVADGMGGHQAGDVASQMTKELLLKKWLDAAAFEKPVDAEAWLGESIRGINKELYDHSQNHSDCQGMGTTIVAAVCTEEFVTVGHVGDSRIYLKNGDFFRQLTDDHSLVGELVKSGQISEDEAMFHPRRNVVLRALGTETEVKIDLETVEWDNGSSLLLCTDGLTDKVQSNEIEHHMNAGLSLHETADELIRLANERGGEDNVTIAIVQLVPPAEGGAPS